MTTARPDVLARAERRFAETFGEMRRARQWWVPGRIELLGKHVDYGGGRSLLVAVERGFHVIARPRADATVHVVDARTGSRLDAALDAALPHAPGAWHDYPRTVLRRLARDFPAARTGADIVIGSSLPSAAGLSSSSALVIAMALPLIAFNNLREQPAWRAAIPDDDALAGYLGAVENGRGFGPFPADFGVGTQGGSQDHTAILRCAQDEVAQYRYLPVACEARIAFPAGWRLVVASSGVPASKGGAVQARYNALAAEVAALLAQWRAHEDPSAGSLLQALESAPDARERLARHLRTGGGDSAPLLARLDQFHEECAVLIPAAAAAIARSDPAGLGVAVARSQALAEAVLRNQVPETIALAAGARTLGAHAASAFGAGFGGSVWAIVGADDAERFAAAWRTQYLARFPGRRGRAEVFVTRAAGGARERAG